ncbi:MATE family efflux transporter [Pseudomaricurvus sp. HS19]|uniref:MATE family efflux transporter n=1 Tax=Pseudomaricurvus sp. HS19 TaxID=2692626 RepID=UPI00136B2B54|nr:MATE family efflux transporter [Pseudomaricurvus sp. HS19]MYM62293.1 MATE family efflux transporter [Pseudomaricurvus sp. HS19]
MAANLSFNTADTYFVGQLGSDSLAAMSFTFPVVLLVTALAVSFATGVSSVYARMLGGGHKLSAQRLVADSLMLAMMIALTIMFIGWWQLHSTFVALGAGPELLTLIEEYMGPWYLNAPFFALSTVFMAVLQASGYARVAGLLMIGTALINIILDPLLIFGFGPIPRFEIAGAAWTTVVSRLLQVALGFYLLVWRYKLISAPSLNLSSTLKAWRATLHVAIPSMGSGLIVPAAGAFTLVLVAGFGPDAVAALGVVQRVEPVIMIVFYALAGIVGPFFGHNMAEQYRHRQMEAMRLILRFSFAYSAISAVLLWLGGEFIGSWFTDSPEIIAIIASFLLLVPFSFGLSGVMIASTSAFNGLGRPLPAVMLSVIRVVLFYVPCVLIGRELAGLNGIFLGTATANVLAGIVSYLWIRQALRRQAAGSSAA